MVVHSNVGIGGKVCSSPARMALGLYQLVQDFLPAGRHQNMILNPGVGKEIAKMTSNIPGYGIFTNIYHKNRPNVGI